MKIQFVQFMHELPRNARLLVNLSNRWGEDIVTNTNGQIAIYQTADGETQIDVCIEQDNVWLTQRQMSEVFDTT